MTEFSSHSGGSENHEFHRTLTETFDGVHPYFNLEGLLDNHDAQPCCTTMLHNHAAQPCCTTMLHNHAAQPCCTTMLHNHAAQPAYRLNSRGINLQLCIYKREMFFDARIVRGCTALLLAIIELLETGESRISQFFLEFNCYQFLVLGARKIFFDFTHNKNYWVNSSADHENSFRLINGFLKFSHIKLVIKFDSKCL